MPVIGVLGSTSTGSIASREPAFRQGLSEIGFVDGRNVAIEYRWAHGQYDRLPKLAADLVDHPVAVIATFGPPAAQAAKSATSTIPIVFTSGDDPVKMGLVPSINRPGGNITGVHLFLSGLATKRLGLLRDLVPQLSAVAVFLNSNNQNAETQAEDLQAAGRAVGLRIAIVNLSSEREIDAAFAALTQQRVGALIVGSDPFFSGRRGQIIALAARHAIPTVYEIREFADAGGLFSYGTSLKDAYRQAGVYAGRILKGEKPADLPVMQSTKFELVINLKTAKALGLTLPSGMLSVADDVID
jgi:putative ABC transport system substrate-binding protein